MTTSSTCEHELHGNAIRTRFCGAPAVSVMTDTDGEDFAVCAYHTLTQLNSALDPTQPRRDRIMTNHKTNARDPRPVLAPALIDTVHALVVLEVETVEGEK